MSAARKLALVLSISYAAAGSVLWLTYTEIVMVALRSLRWAALAPLLLVNHAFSAVIIVELLRVTLPGTTVWGEKYHFTIVTMVWILCFVLGFGFVFLGRTSFSGR